MLFFEILYFNQVLITSALPKRARPELPTRDSSDWWGCFAPQRQHRRQKMNAGKFKQKRLKKLFKKLKEMLYDQN